MKGVCSNINCYKIIIEDMEKYREKYPDEKYVLCPYCGTLLQIKK